MASRPVFLPDYEGVHLVKEVYFDFPWASGFAEVQKKKNIAALHAAAKHSGIENILEISTKSDVLLGRKLSAFSLKLHIENEAFPLESVYQSAKVFRETGAFHHVRSMSPRDAKMFIREHSRGDIISFELYGEKFPLWPKNAFYDWIYIRSLVAHSDWIEDHVKYEAFTDIEFNPSKQVNCQARAFAEYLSLQKRGWLQKAAGDFDFFSSHLKAI